METMVKRLSVMPKVDYTDEEMGELQRTFQEYLSDDSGLLSPRRAQQCIADLSYSFSSSMVSQILEGQVKDKGKPSLDFTDFVAFVDVIGAIDAYVITHLNDLLDGLSPESRQRVCSLTGQSTVPELIQYLSKMVALTSKDDFDFAAVYDLLGYENPSDSEQSPNSEKQGDHIASTQNRKGVSDSPATIQTINNLATPRTNLKPSVNHLQVPREAERNAPVEQPKQRTMSVRFDIANTRTFQLPTLSIPVDEEVSANPAPPRTLNRPHLARGPTLDELEIASDAPDLNLRSELKPVSTISPVQNTHGIAHRSLDTRRSVSPPHRLDPERSALTVTVPKQLVNEEIELDDDDIAYLEEVFKTFLQIFDIDGDGAIAVSELSAALRALGLDPNDQQIQDLFSNADVDRSGLIDFDEFCLYYKQMYASEFKNGVPLHHLEAIFARADTDNNGEISREEFAFIIRKQFPKLSHAGVDQLVDLADCNGDNIIDFGEFVSFLNRPDPKSRSFARKLFRAHLPSPAEHFTAFSMMPSTFRASVLAEIDKEPNASATYHIAPKLSRESFGMRFGDLKLTEGTLKVAAVACEVCLQVELVKANGIPIPNMNRHRIQSRTVRIMLYDGDTPASNQYVLRAHWSPTEEDVWSFSFPISSLQFILVKSSRAQTFLLMELCILVEDEARSQSEMTCGFATIDISRELSSKTVIETTPISGGTIKAKSAINRNEILARREGWRRLTSLFKSRPLPTITVKITPIASKQKEQTLCIPNDVIIPMSAITIIRLFIEVLADVTIRCAQPFVPGNSHLHQEIHIRVFLDLIVNDPGALTVLAARWVTHSKSFSRNDKRGSSPVSPNSFVKAEFCKCILQLWPLLSSPVLPELIVGRTDHERLSLMTHCSKENVLSQLSSDACSIQMGGSRAVDIAKALVFRPFHSEDVSFSYDRYGHKTNIFATLEKGLRELNDAMPSSDDAELQAQTIEGKRVLGSQEQIDHPSK
uniref:EF-hand domain-containing protein n=1 Tax=Spongospora subterranea TaxID=70186 RepID=A0A0H5QIC9_9EUKA|eukprot:CRZ01800.1 hypothetical protein [Spongospora subterranea]